MGGDERPFLRISGVKKRAIDLVGGDGPRSADLLDPISKRKRKKTALLDCARKLHPPLGRIAPQRPPITRPSGVAASSAAALKSWTRRSARLASAFRPQASSARPS